MNNADLLCQWTALMEQFYSVPYAVLSTRAQWDALVTADEPNPFLQSAVVITTYEFAAANEEAAKAVPWDLAVFKEANALSTVYQEGNRQAKALRRIAGSAFKLLLTGTPIHTPYLCLNTELNIDPVLVRNIYNVDHSDGQSVLFLNGQRIPTSHRVSQRSGVDLLVLSDLCP